MSILLHVLKSHTLRVFSFARIRYPLPNKVCEMRQLPASIFVPILYVILHDIYIYIYISGLIVVGCLAVSVFTYQGNR